MTDMLCIVPKYNKVGRKDGDEFFRQSQSFMDYWGRHGRKVCIEVIDNHQPESLQEQLVVSALDTHAPKHVFFFCHGYRARIQFGFRKPAGARRLAHALDEHTAPLDGETQRFVFYSCSVDAGEDNWFNWFCDGLESNNMLYWALGHETAGHTTKNPYVQYRGTTRSFTGSAFLVRPKCPVWSTWVNRMRVDEAFRWRTPFLTPEEVRLELVTPNTEAA